MALINSIGGKRNWKRSRRGVGLRIADDGDGGDGPLVACDVAILLFHPFNLKASPVARSSCAL
ncbi:hypothetical protein [Scleromatobacter humisilvae]|uniref:Uncharacterized protein n=1 Tax=Scleromatobacter humisilvae TaxID=2897159 RepID=A0A9X1YP56_9BURK|nr:hypothetical protein [Scleromatobacter humisilvae]MCK9689442.1 hypothetical protein [Scleromatobacter humisilvae]